MGSNNDMNKNIVIGLAIAMIFGGVLIIVFNSPITKTVNGDSKLIKLNLGQYKYIDGFSWHYTGMPDNTHGTLGCGEGFTLWFTIDSTLYLGNPPYNVVKLTDQYVLLEMIK